MGATGRVTHRCSGCGDDPLYVAYHDQEWGQPERDAEALFERLILEGMQAGLSWYTVLKKRARMREQFFEFDPIRLARFGRRRMNRWLADPGLIRHRGKLEAMVGNAAAFNTLGPEFSRFIWSFVDGEPLQNRWRRLDQVPSLTPQSSEMANALRALGFRFVGPTICYAFMQSVGMVNDHLIDCDLHEQCAKAARAR